MEACSLYDSIGGVVKGLVQCPISHELETFSRLLYRNKNQHRRDRCFQKLVRICKDSKKYQDLKLTEKFKSLQRLLAKYKFNLMSGSSSSNTDYWCDTEIQNSISQLAQQTSRCILFVKKVLQFCEDTFMTIRQHYLTLGLFVPFNLMMCAILSRLWAYLKYHNKFLSQAHMVLTQGQDGKTDTRHVTTQPADIGEMVTLDQHFMQSRVKDFQLPLHVQPIVMAESEAATVKVEKLSKRNTESTIRGPHKEHNKTRHRWRKTMPAGHFCDDCWVRSKRNLVKMSKKYRRNAVTSFKKSVNTRSNVSVEQGTGESFIDNIFSLIK